MELNFNFDKKMLVEMANRVLDEYEYRGKTIREWADLIANPKTRADRIRAMTDEELAAWLCDVAGWLSTFEGMVHPILEWLKQEVTNDP